MSEMCQYSKSRILSVILATEINLILQLVCEEGAPVSWSTDEEMEAETYGTSSQKKKLKRKQGNSVSLGSLSWLSHYYNEPQYIFVPL